MLKVHAFVRENAPKVLSYPKTQGKLPYYIDLAKPKNGAQQFCLFLIIFENTWACDPLSASKHCDLNGAL